MTNELNWQSIETEPEDNTENNKRVVYHWGVWVSSDIPVTGVVSNNSVEWLNDASTYGDYINISEEDSKKEFLREKYTEYCTEHEDDPNCEDVWADDDLMEEWDQEFNDLYEGSEETYLIGDWKKNENGEYDIDMEGKEGFSAIVSYDGFNCSQIIWSKWVSYCALCSPCFPGQGDLDTEGDFLAYDFPENMYGEYRQNTNELLRWIPEENRAINKEGDNVFDGML